MSFFIKCVNPNYLRNALYVLRNGRPHRLPDPRSLDRDWFTNPRKAAEAKREAEKMFKLVAPSTKFRIERR
jgi:hypothetical protein